MKWKKKWSIINTVFKYFEFTTPLTPRDALFGGRTNALKLYHKCQQDEQIKYIDYTSLYPNVHKYGVYPTGHPEILTENFY